ncbi:hypothetical protein [Nibribacter koreensis]|uniref:Uncharacterized protein n=1 Tax=Nibribacter koreensis TaxID=1084519 RepID=A0ABP8F528_9BACT
MENSTLNNKNILIVTEGFTFGGLETHLIGKIKVLNNLSYKVFLAVGKNFAESNLPASSCEKIFRGMNLSLESTSQDFVTTVSQLTEIINENNISVVDAHPFLSVLPAFFAANLNKVRFCYTLHGPASVMEFYGSLVDGLTKHLIFPYASLVAHVSPELKELTKGLVSAKRSKVYRNAISIHSEAKHSLLPLKSITVCLASRLDSFKVEGIKAFLSVAPAHCIERIDIYGDGPETENLAEWISEEIMDGRPQVALRGLSLQIDQVYEQTDLVAGMGRVVLEGAAANKPVLLIGYDGVKGLLDKKRMHQAAKTNFSGRGLESISEDELVRQFNRLLRYPESYKLRDWVDKNANQEMVWSSFVKDVSVSPIKKSRLVADVYKCFENTISPIPYYLDPVLHGKVEKIINAVIQKKIKSRSVYANSGNN